MFALPVSCVHGGGAALCSPAPVPTRSHRVGQGIHSQQPFQRCFYSLCVCLSCFFFVSSVSCDRHLIEARFLETLCNSIISISGQEPVGQTSSIDVHEMFSE